MTKKKQPHYEPYKNKSSMVYHIFEMARKGCKESAIVDFVQKYGGSPHRSIARLKSGYNAHFRWDVDDSHGWIKVHNIRPIPKGNGQTLSKPTPKG